MLTTLDISPAPLGLFSCSVSSEHTCLKKAPCHTQKPVSKTHRCLMHRIHLHSAIIMASICLNDTRADCKSQRRLGSLGHSSPWEGFLMDPRESTLKFLMQCSIRILIVEHKFANFAVHAMASTTFFSQSIPIWP